VSWALNQLTDGFAVSSVARYQVCVSRRAWRRCCSPTTHLDDGMGPLALTPLRRIRPPGALRHRRYADPSN